MSVNSWFHLVALESGIPWKLAVKDGSFCISVMLVVKRFRVLLNSAEPWFKCIDSGLDLLMLMNFKEKDPDVVDCDCISCYLDIDKFKDLPRDDDSSALTPKRYGV